METFSNIGVVQYGATICFALALMHTFATSKFRLLAGKFPSGSIQENVCHLLGEVEVGFGLWAMVFALGFSIYSGFDTANHYLESRDFKEALFVFVIMSVCSTKPTLTAVSVALRKVTRLLPLPTPLASYITLLSVAPLLGSLITEPAAMTVGALILGQKFFSNSSNERFKYATLALLFVNVSIGGTLTPYAAPPVLMVAHRWNWGLGFLLKYCGTSAIFAIVVSTALYTWIFRKEISIAGGNEMPPQVLGRDRPPAWIALTHILFVALLILCHTKPVFLFGVFLIFLALFTVTQKFQDELRLRESLMVGLFLSGVIVLGGFQKWWLEPIVTSLEPRLLYFGAIGLTAITDNAALTYLGSQVPSLAQSAKYLLLAGSVVGGGLTVVANAPNPVGVSILNCYFGEEGISAPKLLFWALPPTLIAALSFWWIFPAG